MNNSVKLYFSILFLIIFCLIYLGYQSKETFVPYTYGPFDYSTTGTDPLSFYMYPAYRKPFMYPYQYQTNYPYSRMTFNEINI
jgi:hypothetical protein